MPIIYNLPSPNDYLPGMESPLQTVKDISKRQVALTRDMAESQTARNDKLNQTLIGGVHDLTKQKIDQYQKELDYKRSLEKEQRQADTQWQQTEASQEHQAYINSQAAMQKLFQERAQQGFEVHPNDQKPLEDLEKQAQELTRQNQLKLIRPAQYYQGLRQINDQRLAYMPRQPILTKEQEYDQAKLYEDQNAGITVLKNFKTGGYQEISSKKSPAVLSQEEKDRIGKLQIARATFKSNHIKDLMSAGLSYEEAKDSAEAEARQTFPDLYPQQVGPDGQPMEAATPELTLPPAAPPVFRVTKQDKQDIRRRTDAVQGLTPSEKTDLYYQELDKFKKSGQQINDREYAEKYGDFRTPDVPTEQTALPQESIQSQEIDVSKLGPAEAAILQAKRKAALAVVMKNPDMKEKSPEEIASEVNRQVNIEEIALGRKPYRFGTQAEPAAKKVTQLEYDDAIKTRGKMLDKQKGWLGGKSELGEEDKAKLKVAENKIKMFEEQQSGIPSTSQQSGVPSPAADGGAVPSQKTVPPKPVSFLVDPVIKQIANSHVAAAARIEDDPDVKKVIEHGSPEGIKAVSELKSLLLKQADMLAATGSVNDLGDVKTRIKTLVEKIKRISNNPPARSSSKNPVYQQQGA